MSTNYFNTLPLRRQLDELGTCRFMDASEFANGVEAAKGLKIVIVGCGAQGLNQGLNMRDSGLNADERRETAREIAKRLKASEAPAHVILTNQGIEEWDRPGGEAHDPEAFAAFCDEMRQQMTDPLLFTELDCHINDQAFVDQALAIFDGWIADGTIKVAVS